MGTLVAVRTTHGFTLAADALHLGEEIIHPNFNKAVGCILRIGDNLIGFN